ncbi:hypothetical protein NFB22_002621 [Escherichia coli]|nr:hypothetical protein [Escherichia coli]
MKLVFVPLKDVFKECKGKRQFSIKKDAYRRFSSVSNEMQIGIKKIAALYPSFLNINKEEGLSFSSSTLAIGVLVLEVLLALTVILWGYGYRLF